MDDDFNTALGISYIYEIIKLANTELNQNDKDLNKLKGIDLFITDVENILGLKFNDEKTSNNDGLLDLILEIRNQLRSEKNYKLSDEIRDRLNSLGIEINDR